MPTVYQAEPAEYLIERSRFIGQAFRIIHPDEVESCLTHMRASFPAANHYTWAYRINDASVRASDNGEPHGTAGRPILHILTQADWIETLVVVVRYFGGIKLGRGGLVRAYQEAAQQALKKSIAGVVTPVEEIALHLSYRAFERILRKLEPLTLEVVPEFAEHVVLHLRVQQSQSGAVRDLLDQNAEREWEIVSSKVDTVVIPQGKGPASGLQSE
jgi:uncharacterized YigZ family protein